MVTLRRGQKRRIRRSTGLTSPLETPRKWPNQEAKSTSSQENTWRTYTASMGTPPPVTAGQVVAEREKQRGQVDPVDDLVQQVSAPALAPRQPRQLAVHSVQDTAHHIETQTFPEVPAGDQRNRRKAEQGVKHGDLVGCQRGPGHESGQKELNRGMHEFGQEVVDTLAGQVAQMLVGAPQPLLIPGVDNLRSDEFWQ